MEIPRFMSTFERNVMWNSPGFVKSENQELEHSSSWFAVSGEPAQMKTRRSKSIVELHEPGGDLASLDGFHKIRSGSFLKHVTEPPTATTQIPSDSS